MTYPIRFCQDIICVFLKNNAAAGMKRKLQCQYKMSDYERSVVLFKK